MGITKIVYCVRKRAELSSEDFYAYWLERHGPLVRSLWENGHIGQMVKYVQSHTILGAPSDNLRAGRGAGPAYDGITEVWIDDTRTGGSTVTAQAAVDSGKILFDDEAKFIDFASSSVFVTLEHVILDGTSTAHGTAHPNTSEHTDAITRVKSRYFRYLDTKQWDRFAELFTDDAVLDTSDEMRRLGMDPELGMARGNKNIAQYVSAAVEGVSTVHHGHMNEVELLTPTSAKAIWAMEDKLWWPEGSGMAPMHGYGHYHETYELGADGNWRIKTLKLTRLRVD